MAQQHPVEVPVGVATEGATFVVDQDVVQDSELATVEMPVRQLEIGEEADYHRISAGCPKGFTQQCGIGYRS